MGLGSLKLAVVKKYLVLSALCLVGGLRPVLCCARLHEKRGTAQFCLMLAK